MEIKINNLTYDFIKYWEAARNKKFEDKKVLWKSQYENKHREIFDHFITIFSSEEKRFIIENHLEKCFDIYEKEYNNIKSLRDIDKKINELCGRCSEQFNIRDIKLNFVIMIGLNMANAFATGFNNGTNFYFLEKIGDKNYVDILLIHEITHLFHYSQILNDEFENTVATSIMLEGLAVFNEQCTCPGFTISEYICFTDGMDYWIDHCNSILKNLKPILLGELGKSGEYIDKYFYGDNSTKDGIPTRIGYLVGYYVVKDLNKNYPLSEIITWDSQRIEKEVRDSIERII